MKYSIALSGVVLLTVSTVLQAGASGPTRVEPRTTILSIQPARLATGQSYSLLVKPADQTPGDAVPLYQQAVQKMPTNINSEQLADWTRLPLNELPLTEVEAFLQRAQPCLELLDKATRCRAGVEGLALGPDDGQAVATERQGAGLRRGATAGRSI